MVRVAKVVWVVLEVQGTAQVQETELQVLVVETVETVVRAVLDSGVPQGLPSRCTQGTVEVKEDPAHQ